MITDELRKWAEEFWEFAYSKFGDKAELLAIADRIDSALADGYIELPKDRDGEYIHIGDEMDTEHFGTVEVEGFMHGAVAFCNYSEQPARICTVPGHLCHYHKPTVEDMLWELLGKILPDMEDEEAVPIVKAYAEKMRLADGKEQQ